MKKRILSLILTFCMLISMLPAMALAADVGSGESGARSDTVANSSDKNNVFLGNDKLELGINECGTFGSTVVAPNSEIIFHPDQNLANGYLGMRTYSDETAGWNSASDFFLPGRVDEGFVFAWATSNGSNPECKAMAQSTSRGGVTPTSYSGYSTTDESTKDELKAETKATVDDTLSYNQTVSFAKDSGVAGVKLVLKNNSSDTLYNLEYVRGFDPDQGRGSGVNATGNAATDNYYYRDDDGTVWVIASAYNPNTSESVAHTFEDFTKNYSTYPFIFMAPASNDYTVTPVYQKVGWNQYSDFNNVTSSSTNYKLGYSTYADEGIGLRFRVPSLAAGESVTLYYNMSLDSDITSALAQLMGGTIAAQPESYVAKTGDSVKLSVDMDTLFQGAAAGTTYTYQWESCDTEDGTYTSINGATGDTYEAPTTTAGTTFYRCVVTPSLGNSVTTGCARVTVLNSTETTCTVKFDANTTDTITNMPGEQTVRKGDKVLEPDPPVRNGYVLAGWYTEKAYTNQWDFASDTTDDMTLYAKWIKPLVPTVSIAGGKITAAHGSAEDGQNLSTYTLEYSPDNGENWYTYASDKDGTGIDFTQFANDGYSGTTATVLFRQNSTIDGTAGIIGTTTTATTMYKVSHSIAKGDKDYGSVTLAVTGDGSTEATDIGSMGNAYPAGVKLTYTASPSSTEATSYFAGINGSGKFTDLAGTFTATATTEKGEYGGGTYIFDNLSGTQSSEFYFGNWKAGLATAFADDTADNAADLKAALGEVGSDQRKVFTTLFPDVNLTTYDNLMDKDQVLSQYVKNDATNTADEMVADLQDRTADSRSVFENFVETQSQLEGNPTYPEVSINPTTGIATVTPPSSVTSATVTVKDSSGDEITAESDGTYNFTENISDAPDNYITVQVTDGDVNYNVTVRVYVNVSRYKVEENCTNLNSTVGGTMGINSDNTGDVESTLNNATRTDDIYTIQRIQWKKSGDDSWSSGYLPTGQPYQTTLTVNPEDGSYFTGFRYGTKLYTPDNVENFRTACGDKTASIIKNENGSTDPADWIYTLTYTPKDKQIIVAQYRNLLGEINAATTISQIESVISDSNYAEVMHDATGTQFNSSSDITGTASKDTFNVLGDTGYGSNTTSKDTVLTKMLNAITERNENYTIQEFNTALYWTSTLQKIIDDGLAKVKDAYTAGSWTELQNVLSSIKTEYDAADGDPNITTERVKELCGQMQAASDQLTIKTLAVEIVTNADGTTNSVSFDAENPSQSSISTSAGQNGYVFPVYETGVTLSVKTGADYNVEYIVNDDAKADLNAVNNALDSITEHTNVKIIFTKKTVKVTLPATGIEAIANDTDTNTEGLQVNINEDAAFRVVAGDGQILIPGATVKYTVGGVEKSTTIQSDGTFTINATGNIVITDISAAVKDLDSSSLTALLSALQSEYDSSSDALYNTTDLNWTQESWENFFGTDNENNVYGGVFGEALAIANNTDATDAQIQEAVNSLTEAINTLKPQYTITLADGFNVQGAVEKDGQPITNPQTGVVKIGETWYAAEGASLSLDVTVPDGYDLNKISYIMDGQTLYAWASGGVVTIYGVSGNVDNFSMDTSESGFTVTPTTGGIGAATGIASNGDTYTLTPNTGNKLVSITIDDLKTTVPGEAELAGIVSAAFADYTEGDVGKTTVKIDGTAIEFSKYNVADPENDIPAGTIIGTLPGVGKVQITVSDSTVTATVLKAGSDGYKAGTVITLATDDTSDHVITLVKMCPAEMEYDITFGSPIDGATVTWAKQNTGAHSITAVTTLKLYTVTIADDGGEPPVNVGGITTRTDSVKSGGTVTFTIPAPADVDDVQQEIAMDSTMTFTVGKTNYSDSLTALNNEAKNGISVVINSDGSATLTITKVSGNVDVTAATINTVTRGTTKIAQGLVADKTLFTQKLTALQNAITEANRIKTNAGNIYKKTTDKWAALTDSSTGEIKKKTDLNTNLLKINLDSISDEEAFVTELENTLGVESGTNTLDQLLTMIDTATSELTGATEETKILAEDVISIPENTQYQGGGTSVTGLKDKGTVGTDSASCASGVINTTDGADLVISGIKTGAGYLPALTYTAKGTDGSYDVVIRVAKDGDSYKAQIASADSDGNTTWTDMDDVTVKGSVEATTQAGTFSVTIPNNKLITVLGEDTSDPTDSVNDSLSNITNIDVGTYRIGREMSTAQEILDSTAVGSYMGVSQVDIDTINDGTADFKAGLDQSNKDTTPLISDDATVSLSFTFTQDTYNKGSNVWYKELYGVVINDVTYMLDENDQFPEDSGLTYTKITDPSDVLKITDGNILIDTKVYTGELTGIQLLCRPTNSQYTTYVQEYGEVNSNIDDLLKSSIKDNISGMTEEELLSYLGIADINALTEDSEYYNDLYEDADDNAETPKTLLAGSVLTEELQTLAREKALGETDLSDLSDEQIESVLKQIKRLIAQTTGTYATGGVNEYYLTQENKNCLATEIEQLKLLERKLNALDNAKNFTDAVNELYSQVIEEGLELPLSSPITDEKKAILTKLAAEIESLESQYDTLTDYEKTLIAEETENEFSGLGDAVEVAREDGMTDDEIFETRVDSIDEMITDPSPYTIDDPDLVLKRINQAYDMYEDLSNEEKADVSVKEVLLDTLKDKLNTYFNTQAAEFAENWLTTDYTGTSDDPGSTAFDSHTNRIDSDKTKDGYDHRISLAKNKYDALPASVQAAVDELFNIPTMSQLYAETFPSVDSLVDVDDGTVADNFISTYLTVSGSIITDAADDTYQKLLDAESAWGNLTSTVQAEVNSRLTEDSGGKTYPELLEIAKDIEDALTGPNQAAQTFINQYLLYDGSVITNVTDANKSMILAAKDRWDTLDSSVQTAVNKLLTDTYKGLTFSAIYEAANQTDSDDSDNTSSGSHSSHTSHTSVPVIVDGVSYDIGTQITKNGTTTVTPDQTELKNRLENVEKYGKVTIPISPASNASTSTASLVLKNIEDMAVKNVTLTIKESNVSYDLPTSAVDIDGLMTELGATTPSDVPVQISITKSDEKAQSQVQSDLESLGAKMVVTPMEFKVTATYGGKTVEVSHFGNYVSRTIEVTKEQAKQITTAVVHEADGSIRHVPTYVYENEGKWYAKINSLTNSTYALIYNEQNFTDAAGKWYEDVANEMDSRKIVEGRDDGEFHGEDSITRAEFAAILVRALGLPADGNGGVFTDVSTSKWYYGAVGTAYEYGLVEGKTTTTFDPTSSITRQEAMLMIARAAKVAEFTGTSGEIAAFTDAGNVNNWALDAVKFDVGSSLIIGDNNKLSPQKNITRSESATIILRLLQKAKLVDVRSNV